MLMTLKNLHKTFYSAPFYRALLTSWKGIGLGFLFVITILNVGQLVYLTREPIQAFMEEGEGFFAALPELEISGGTIKAEGQMPLKLTLFKNYQGKELVILFDTNSDAAEIGALTKQMEEENVFVLVNKNAISIFNVESKNVDIRSPKEMKDAKITHDQWIKMGQNIRAMIGPITLLTIFCVMFVFQILTALAGAVLLFIIAPLFKVEALFVACMRLSSAAKVPVAVLFLVLPPQMALQVLLWFGFAAFGLLASRAALPEKGPV